MKCYPDGIDLSTDITELVWAKHYIANSSLYEININKTLYKEICYIIDNQHIHIPILITNSHVKIFDFIEKHFNNKQIVLTHIDWHHDMMNDNKKWTVGNWVEFLKEKYPETIVKWITRE